ncbi:DUF2637 domain-containing protein [Streptomyces sp. RLB1-9]|uniref:DUF2637 domain-containing protein n=1 Tax=Streptomyces sp. RLB1-9 TaxID=2594454 RepID=UPI001968487B|nr:DUF2637 domain-containing protein [Streptomyces sp. RLB1-9]
MTKAVVSYTGTTWRTRAAQADWDRLITDGMIYLIAIGGFYVGYQTLYAMALKVGMPADQAAVVSAIADMAILAYSRKAVQEIKEGRSAWGIRTIVAAASLATFSLQLRAAWPHPTSLGFHGLAPAAWILGHEMMLRGRLRTAKAARRAAQIAAGLRPAPLPAIRPAWWLLAPFSTFTVWRLVKLWEKSQDYVIRIEAARRKDKGKNVPRAWEGYLLTTQTPAAASALVLHEICTAFFTPEDLFPEPGWVPPVTSTLYRESDPAEKVPSSEVDALLRMLPEAPAKGRPEDKAIEYIRRVENLAAQRDIKITGVFLAELLQVDGTRISKLRKIMTTP